MVNHGFLNSVDKVSCVNYLCVMLENNFLDVFFIKPYSYEIQSIQIIDLYAHTVNFFFNS